MQIASSVFALLTLLTGHANLTGTWRLDRIKSDFGTAAAPQQFVLDLDQTGNRLDATILSAGLDGKRVSYRQCRVESKLNGALSCITADGVTTEETWQVTAPDELTITRVVPNESQPIRQRLVLARSTLLE